MRNLAVLLPATEKSASSGTAKGFSLLSTEALTRFSIQPSPCGEGRNAESASAAHTRRPNTSPKPPTTGFHALDGGCGAATLSQPFQGKSRSLTVRGKIGEARPSSAS